MQRWTVHLEGGPRRVNHAAVTVGDRIYSFGGYCTGEDYETTRPMDVHVLDTISLRWRLVPTSVQEDCDESSMPYQRYGHTAVGYEEAAYIWGGRNDKDGACNVLFKFDTATLSWSRPKVKGTLPGKRDGHSACCINGKMYIFGGYEELLDHFSDDIHTFDFTTSTWEYVRCKGTPARWRDFHTATAIGDVMYVFGGRSDEGGNIFTNHEIYCNKIETFNTITQTWHEPVTHGIQPIGRRSHSAFVHGGKLYIFGGFNGLHEIHFRDVFKFDPELNMWSIVKVNGQGPCARRRQCCCMIDSRVYLFGGTSPTDSGYQAQQSVSESDLRDHSDLHILDFEPSLKTLCQLTVLRHKLDLSCLPHDLRWELLAMTTNNVISRPMNSNG